ncbi:SH3 domain-containing protein [Oleiharenicola sp. Vm1]|uniref:SH3 domain-containing protein n=1 Tax=Oleiharenicola sp. Vm1 TaxID=3398393 RepID=UPI0039F4FBA2
MKIKLPLLALALATAARVAADTVATDTAVFQQADAKSPVLTRLTAGSTITVVGDAPAGWRRVEVDGSFEGYSRSREITKALSVREGANIYSEPKVTSAVLTLSQKGDKSEVIGLSTGDWLKVRIEKKLQGFIAVGATANRPSATAAAPVPAPAAPYSAAPAAPSTEPGRPVPITGNSADTPRLFTGIFSVARATLFGSTPVYDYQLTDSTGRRFAYVDMKRLVLTEKIESYVDLQVVITGTVRNTVDGKDLVVVAEAIQRK